MRSYLTAVIAAAFLGALHIAFPVSAEINLDESFGSNGVTLTSVGRGHDKAYSIVIQENGMIVVAGSSAEGTQATMALVRYTPDGLLDPEFSFPSGPVFRSLYEQVLIESAGIGIDGRIVLGGSVVRDGRRAGVLVRTYENGLVDESFGLNGTVLLEDTERETGFHDLEISPDGSVTVVGFSLNGEIENPIAARFSNDGTIDSSFGQDGIVIETQVAGRYQGMAVGPAGAVLACGYVIGDSGNKGLYLRKFRSDLSPDEGFGTDGTVTLFEADTDVVAHDLDVDSRGLVFAGGESSSDAGISRLLIAGFSENGQPLEQFGDDGVLVHDIPDSSGAYSIKVIEDQALVAAGFRKSESGSDVVMLRKDIVFEAGEQSGAGVEEEEDGDEVIKIAPLVVEDEAYRDSLPAGEAELITTVLTGSDEEIKAIAVGPGGMIYTAGYSGGTEKSAIMVSRYLSESRSSGSGGAGATVSDYYTLSTTPVTAVTRTGGVTGGQILSLSSDTDECLEECLDVCDPDDTTEVYNECRTACAESCAIPTIVKRGVVYSVEPYPEYDTEADDDTDDEGDEETDTDDMGSTADSDIIESIVSENGLLDLKGYLVVSGQTDDGEGDGSYTSEITGLNPQTVYYVRAYCELSDGTYLYGNEYRFKTDDACFIATAAFGSIDMFAVKVLRQFRDRCLMGSEVGRIAVSGYYAISPPLADMVQSSMFMRLLVILMLIPALIGAAFMLYVPFCLQCAFFLVLVIPGVQRMRLVVSC